MLCPRLLFVLLVDIYVVGLIHVSALPADYYLYDPITYTLCGENGGKKFFLGQKLTVVLINVNMDERQIDLELYSQ